MQGALPSRLSDYEPLTDSSRGPEIESWFGVDDDTDPSVDNDWSFLPFMALSDGAHAYDTKLFRHTGNS